MMLYCDIIKCGGADAGRCENRDDGVGKMEWKKNGEAGDADRDEVGSGRIVVDVGSSQRVARDVTAVCT